MLILMLLSLLWLVNLGSFMAFHCQVARANWQHGAEACQRGLNEASEAWRQSAPYLDKGILLVNLAMAVAIGGSNRYRYLTGIVKLEPYESWKLFRAAKEGFPVDSVEFGSNLSSQASS